MLSRRSDQVGIVGGKFAPRRHPDLASTPVDAFVSRRTLEGDAVQPRRCAACL
jgi:hypothetical protein